MKTSQPQKNTSNGWELVPVSDVFTFVKSYAFSRDNLSSGILSGDNIGNIHYGDIHATFTSENINLSKIEIPIVKEASFNPKKEELLKDGDLIMADASEDLDGIGVAISVHGIGKNRITGGLHTFVLRDEKRKTSEYYRQYIFLNKEIRNKLQKVANGVSVYGISKTALSKMELLLPSLSEQNRIVSVLETWDKSIKTLAQIIEAKKQIKKCLMQDLLTGKKRLKGFTDKWENVELQDICLISMGQSPSSNAYNEVGLGLPLIQGNNDIKSRKTVSRIWTTEITKIANKGDIIMTVRAPVGWIGVATTDVCIGRGVCSIRAIKVDQVFILKLLENFETRWKSFEQGSTFTAVNSSDIKALSLLVPKSKEEQKAIAHILSAADKEVNELEKKLLLLKEQKKYLLDNLITGTIRTPETLSAPITK